MSGNPKQVEMMKNKSGPERADETLSSGDLARHSGLYRLEHDSHGVETEVFVRKGTPFPVCNDCGKPVTFILVRKVEHIEDDPDFR